MQTTTHSYKDAEGPDDTFDVYEKNGKWFWSFSPVWRDAGPFDTKEQAVAAGENFVDETGKPYIE